MLRKRSRRVSTNAAAISSPVQMPWKRFWNFVKPLRMQLVRTAQPKHKINLLSLSTEAGGPDVGHLVCSINSMQFVRTAQFKHKHLLALYSHSPRRTGGPQAPASGPRKTQRVNSTTPRSRRFLKSFPIFPIWGMFFGVSAQSGVRLLLCDSAGGGSTQPHRGQDFFQRLPNLQQCRRWSKHSDFVF